MLVPHQHLGQVPVEVCLGGVGCQLGDDVAQLRSNARHCIGKRQPTALDADLHPMVDAIGTDRGQLVVALPIPDAADRLPRQDVPRHEVAVACSQHQRNIAMTVQHPIDSDATGGKRRCVVDQPAYERRIGSRALPAR